MIEPTVRELISSGKYKTALDQAKDLHKAHGTPASEALLIDAYIARIQSLTQAGLSVEATALLNLVRERFPSAKERLAMLSADNLARSGKLEELLAPLNDPALEAAVESGNDEALQQAAAELRELLFFVEGQPG